MDAGRAPEQATTPVEAGPKRTVERELSEGALLNRSNALLRRLRTRLSVDYPRIARLFAPGVMQDEDREEFLLVSAGEYHFVRTTPEYIRVLIKKKPRSSGGKLSQGSIDLTYGSNTELKTDDGVEKRRNTNLAFSYANEFVTELESFL